MHILPKGFTRIRHYGILSGTWKKKHLKALQEKLGGQKGVNKETKITTNQLKHLQCPSCKKGTLHTIFAFTKIRPPPAYLLEQIKNPCAELVSVTKKDKQKNIK